MSEQSPEELVARTDWCRLRGLTAAHKAHQAERALIQALATELHAAELLGSSICGKQKPDIL